jgi:hypothetical protein
MDVKDNEETPDTQEPAPNDSLPEEQEPTPTEQPQF